MIVQGLIHHPPCRLPASVKTEAPATLMTTRLSACKIVFPFFFSLPAVKIKHWIKLLC